MRTKHHQGFVLWFTGLPQAGKSTIANNVYKILRKKGVKAERLDGDLIRKSLSADLGFTKKDRNTNIERVTLIAKLLSRNGVAVLASFVSPYRKQRNRVRKSVTNFIEVFVNTPIEICEKRDAHGLYKKAREGKIMQFTGISDPYENPKNPEIEIYTHRYSIEKSVQKILGYLIKNNHIQNEKQ